MNRATPAASISPRSSPHVISSERALKVMATFIIWPGRSELAPQRVMEVALHTNPASSPSRTYSTFFTHWHTRRLSSAVKEREAASDPMTNWHAVASWLSAASLMPDVSSMCRSLEVAACAASSEYLGRGGGAARAAMA